jgi:hypothetical protein
MVLADRRQNGQGEPAVDALVPLRGASWPTDRVMHPQVQFC